MFVKIYADLFTLVFATTGYWKAAILVSCWKQKTALWRAQICISTGTLVPSLLWHFLHHFFSILFCSQWKKKKFNMASTKIANTHTLQWKYKPHFKLPKNSVPRLCKAQYRNWHYGSERSQDLHMCQWKPRTRHIPDWKTNEPHVQKYLWSLFRMCFHGWKFRHTKKNPNHMSKQVRVSKCVFYHELFIQCSEFNLG